MSICLEKHQKQQQQKTLVKSTILVLVRMMSTAKAITKQRFKLLK